MKKQGASTLIIAIVLMVTSSLIILFAANYGQMQNKLTGNINRSAQAYEAAQAGLEYGINYLKTNAATITASPSGGFISYTNPSLTNVTLANNSQFTVSYANPIANNYLIMTVTSTGVSDDGSSTRVIRQQVKFGSVLLNTGTRAVTSKGVVTVSSNGEVINTATNQTILSAMNVTLSGSGETVTSSGGSTAGNIGPDIQANNAALASTSVNNFFASFFGTTSTSNVKAQMAHTYSNSTDTDYSATLNGMNGTTIWIDQTNGTTASITGNTTIGTSTNPVLIIVNGSLSMVGNITVNGFIFIIGTSGITTLTGNLAINGAIASSDTFNMSGNSQVSYDPTILKNLQNNPSISYWAKIPGSWKDF